MEFHGHNWANPQIKSLVYIHVEQFRVEVQTRFRSRSSLGQTNKSSQPEPLLSLGITINKNRLPYSFPMLHEYMLRHALPFPIDRDFLEDSLTYAKQAKVRRICHIQ